MLLFVWVESEQLQGGEPRCKGQPQRISLESADHYLTSQTDKHVQKENLSSSLLRLGAARLKKLQRCPHVSLSLWRNPWSLTCPRPSWPRWRGSCLGRKQCEYKLCFNHVYTGTHSQILAAFSTFHLFLVSYNSTEWTLFPQSCRKKQTSTCTCSKQTFQNR